MGKKETFSLRFDEDRRKDLTELMNSQNYKTVTSQIENNIKLFKNISMNTEKELRNYFNIFEGQFMIRIFKNVVVDYNEKLSVKEYLIQIFEFGRYNMNEFSNINFEKLSEKINKLNDIQAFVIINIIVNYYNNVENINIYDLSIIDSDNIYSIDIIYRQTSRNIDNEIKECVYKNLDDNYAIDNSIKLTKVNIPDYNVVSIIFRAAESLDLSKKFDLKMDILAELKNVGDIADINVNNICL